MLVRVQVPPSAPSRKELLKREALFFGRKPLRGARAVLAGRVKSRLRHHLEKSFSNERLFFLAASRFAVLVRSWLDALSPAFGTIQKKWLQKKPFLVCGNSSSGINFRRFFVAESGS